MIRTMVFAFSVPKSTNCKATAGFATTEMRQNNFLTMLSLLIFEIGSNNLRLKIDIKALKLWVRFCFVIIVQVNETDGAKRHITVAKRDPLIFAILGLMI